MSNHDFDLDLPTPTWKQFQEVFFFSVIEKRNLLKTFSNTLVGLQRCGEFSVMDLTLADDILSFCSVRS